MEKQNLKREKYIDWGIFALLLAGYTLMMFTLFYRQTLGNPGYYHSDMKAYILEMQGLDSGYSFPYPIFFKLGALLFLFIDNPPLCIALAVTMLNSLSPVALKYYMNKGLLQQNSQMGEQKRIIFRVLITVLVFTIFFVSMVYPPSGISLPGIRHKYVGVFSPNPFHNATYNATRPFAIVAFFLFGRILGEYEKKTDIKGFALFGVFLLLTTMTKPSFTFVLVPTAGLIMLYRLVKARFRNFMPSLYLGICFIPTFVALLYQFFGVFAPSGAEENGIGFGMATAWRHHCSNILLAVGLALGFPLLVLILNYRELKKNGIYRFSWQMMSVSMAEVLFLYEKGFRLPDMNFSWGYMHGLFFVFVTSVLLLLQKTVRREGNPWLILLQWLAYGCHLVCGVYYFMGIFAGRSYY